MNSCLERYLTQISTRAFLCVVLRLQRQISGSLHREEQEELDKLWEAVFVLDVFYKANLKREEADQVSYRQF